MRFKPSRWKSNDKSLSSALRKYPWQFENIYIWRMKKFISIQDVKNLPEMVQQAIAFKKEPFSHQELGKNKTAVLLFFNPSLRTRLSTQKAAQNLGMNVIVMNIGSDGWKIEMEDGTVMDGDTQEHIREAVAVISTYADVIGVRTFPSLADKAKDYEERIINAFVNYSTVPVVSLESATAHPLQGFADVMTIEELRKTDRPKVVLTWAPHPKALPQAVPNSFVRWVKETDAELVVACPEGYELDAKVLEGVTVVHDQKEAFKNADFICAKNWSSFEEYGQILPVKESWTVTASKLEVTNEAKFMHCLPVRRNVVVADDVLDSPQSVVIQEADNRVWTAQAVLKEILLALQ